MNKVVLYIRECVLNLAGQKQTNGCRIHSLRFCSGNVTWTWIQTVPKSIEYIPGMVSAELLNHGVHHCTAEATSQTEVPAFPFKASQKRIHKIALWGRGHGNTPKAVVYFELFSILRLTHYMPYLRGAFSPQDTKSTKSPEGYCPLLDF